MVVAMLRRIRSRVTASTSGFRMMAKKAAMTTNPTMGRSFQRRSTPTENTSTPESTTKTDRRSSASLRSDRRPSAISRGCPRRR